MTIGKEKKLSLNLLKIKAVHGIQDKVIKNSEFFNRLSQVPGFQPDLE